MDEIKLRVVILVQARMGSSRLRGKVLKEVMDKPLLHYLIERLQRVELKEEIVITTTVNVEDEKIVDFCRFEKIPIFRGQSEDVLDRFYYAAQTFKADVIVRITADCPLSDPLIIDQVIKTYLDNYPKYDYVSNSHMGRSYPVGMDVEVFSFKALEEAFHEATLPEEREHVTPFIYRRPTRYHKKLISHQPDLSNFRLTVDTIEDFELINKLLEDIYPKKPNFTMDDIIHILQFDHPEWVKINCAVKQRELP